MKLLTAAEMREVDRKTIEEGIPGLVLMENAGHRVVEFLERRYSPLSGQRIVVICGKGNNGGDGFVIARQLFTRFRPRSLHVVLAASARDLQGDAAANHRMWLFCGGSVQHEITPEMQNATLVIDALLGTGLSGPVTGSYAELIREMNEGFPLADVIAVDIPSGMPSDGRLEGACVWAAATVTFTAPKVGQALAPNYERCGELVVGEIGSPRRLFERSPLNLTDKSELGELFAPRPRNSNKGMYGHVLVVAGGPGKTGAAAMTGISALRAGAGLVTVASDEAALPEISGHAPELMTAPARAAEDIFRLAREKNILAIGPGLGTAPETAVLVKGVFDRLSAPLVVDADGLNVLAGSPFRGSGPLRVLTPHPGEMSRLTGASTAEIQQNRLACARRFAADRQVCVVLKGDRTVVAFPDGRAWINPTGSPAMSTGGTGDILTGMIAGMMAQFQSDAERAILAAVWLHGRAGEIGAQNIGEKSLIATDLLRYLPEAMREVSNLQ